jgi:tetratricopeptide (TPR) repeat protein
MFRAVKPVKSNYAAGKRRRAAWLLMALLLSVIGPSMATAQDKDPLAQKLDAIRDRMEKGQALFVAKDYSGAAAIFDAGYREYPYSAFLFNSGVCYQKLKDADKALERFREYVRTDSQAPDVNLVKERITTLEAALAAAQASMSDAGLEDAATTTDAAVPLPEVPEDRSTMKSLVVVETEPPDAPLKLYARVQDGARPFAYGASNPGWQEVVATNAPASLTLGIGRYHIVVEKFRDFNTSEADIDVAPGHVLHFKANLSQGAFMAFLRVSANVQGASVYVDDNAKKRPAWGSTPHGELVPAGKHSVLIEAPGFQPLLLQAQLTQGEQKEMQANLVRVGYGFLRITSNATEIKIKVDEKPVGYWRSGEAPLDVRLDSGKHKLTVSAKSRQEYEGIVEVPHGQVLPLQAHMIPKYPRGAAWTQTAIGVAFVGAAIYFGTESNRLHDDLKADRKKGVLEQDDGRVVRGRWYAVGADAGFAIGGALGALAVYNFIRDPLPDSSVQLNKPVEFDDPRAQRPTARGPSRALQRLAQERGAKPGLELTPNLGSSGAGLTIGGAF